MKGGEFDGYLRDVQRKRADRPSSRRRALGQDPPEVQRRPVDLKEIHLRRTELHANRSVPSPPFWGPRVIDRVDPKALLPFLNETMLFQFHWGFKKQGRSRAEWRRWANREVRPILKRLLATCAEEDILQVQAAYGYWKCVSEGDSVVLFEPDGRTEVARFGFPRQKRSDGLCIADFLMDAGAGRHDVIGLQVVTAGQRVSEVARQWFGDNRYQDYLYLHGLGVEMAEAMAEYVHKRIRAELGFADEDARDKEALLKQGYRGSRFSFGYPACPNMADQRILLSLLGADRIGIEMAEEDQLHPEQSTSALVVLHPQAKYFSV
jgi:5-methyltetrahydrofolate--homocysteine methyltransferase